MARYDFRTPRLFVDAALRQGTSVALDAGQANYLCNVLRLAPGDGVLVFNGREGEWRAVLERVDKRRASLAVGAHSRDQDRPADLHYAFAPLKHARLDYVVQKAVELGVSRLVPVMTRHTQVTRVNLERMRANAIEAAEQCGVLTIPDIAPPEPLERFATALAPGRMLIFCDEEAEIRDPIAALAAVAPGTPLAVLIGPEGGFAEEERAMLLRQPHVIRLALGPRILRADTAAVVALALVQAALGDWRANAGRSK
jgi:16S rRNA (uracil1498-N3)-methyltransferase